MSSPQVGSGHVAIYPTFDGFQAKTAQETRQAGQAGGKTFSSAFKSAVDSGGLTSSAVTKMQREVTAASKDVARTRAAEADASGRVRVAESALTEAREKYGAESAKAVAAEEKLSSAKRKLETAQQAATVSTDRLKTAQDGLRQANLGAAVDGDEKALNRLKLAAERAGTSLQRARDRQADAAGRVKVAEAALAEAIEKGGKESAGAVRASERLASAQRSLENAQIATEKASEKVAAAQKDVATATQRASTEVAQAGTAGANRFSDAWGSIKSKLSPTIRKGVADAGNDAAPAATQAGKQTGAGFTAAMGKVLAGLAVLQIGSKVKDFLVSAGEEAFESLQVTKTTEQIIKSTGGAAKVTAEHVGDLATAISNKTGIDDEAVQSSANLLLTFKNVRNEVGQGANIFDRATAAAQDLSKAGFGDADSAAKMLGKALNDPVAGLTSLGRAGVTFTAQQKAQIKALVASGDTLAAQKIIMGEVESQVGGVASASATAAEKMATGWANVKEGFGTALMPVLDALAGVLATRVFPALNQFTTWLTTKLSGGVKAASQAMSGLQQVWAGFTAPNTVGLEGLAAIGATIRTSLQPVMNAIGTIFEGAKQAVAGFVAGFGGMDSIVATMKGILPLISGPIGIVRAALVGVFSGGAGGIDFAGFGQSIGAAIKPVAEVAVQLGALVTQFVTALMPPLISVFQSVVPAVMAIVQSVSPLITTLGGALMPIISTISTTIVPPLVDVFTQVADLLTTFVIPAIVMLQQMIMAGLMPVINYLVPIVQAAFTMIAGVIGGALQVISGVIQVFTGLLTGDWSKAWDGVKKIFSGVWNAILAVLNGVVALMKANLGGAMGAIQGVITGVMNSVVGFIRGIPGRIMAGLAALAGLGAAAGRWFGGFLSSARAKFGEAVNFVRSIPGKLVSALGNLGGKLTGSGRALIQGLIDGIKSMIGKATSAVKGVLDGIAKFLPHSPADEGPFSGRGWTLYSGRAIIGDLAKGIDDGSGGLIATAKSTIARLSESLTVNPVASIGAALAGAAAGASTGGSIEVTNVITQTDPFAAAHAVSQVLGGLT